MMRNRIVSFCTLVLSAIFLAACAAPTPTATPAPTVTLVPPVTATPLPSATPTLTPSPTATATRTATATPTLTAAESRAATLRALPGYAWKASSDTITLTDAKGALVATLDEKSGGVLRVSPDAAAVIFKLDDATKIQFLKANAKDVKIIQTPYFTDKDNQPRAENVILVTEKGEIKNVPIPKDATATWDEAGKRVVVTNHTVGVYPQVDYISSYIINGKKDISPTIEYMLAKNKILGDDTDKKRIVQVLIDDYPIVTDGLLELVDNFNAKPGSPEFKVAFVKNHPGVNFDLVLKAVEKYVTEQQEGVYGISAIGTFDGFNEDPSAHKFNNPTNYPKFYWGGSLGKSSIGIPRNFRSLNEAVFAEMFSTIVGGAIIQENIITISQMYCPNRIERKPPLN